MFSNITISNDKQSARIFLPEEEDAINLINIVRNTINGNPTLKEMVDTGFDGQNITLALKEGVNGNIADIIASSDIKQANSNITTKSKLDYIVETYPEQVVAALREWMQDNK